MQRRHGRGMSTIVMRHLRGQAWHGSVRLCGLLLGVGWGLCLGSGHAYADSAVSERWARAPLSLAHISEAHILPGVHDAWPEAADGGLGGTRVPLGHEWRKHLRTQAGAGVWTYRLALPTLTDPAAATDAVLYVPRAGNRLRFLLDGVELAHFGHLDDDPQLGQEDFSPYPLLIRVPPVLRLAQVGLQPAHVLLVQVAGDSRRYTGLSTVWWGLARDLEPVYTWRRLATENFFLLILWLDVVFAVGATVAGWALRQKSLLLFGVTSALGAVHYYFWRETAPSLPFGAWLFAQDLSLAWNLLGMQLVCFHIMRMRVMWFARVLTAVLVFYYPLASLLAVTGVAAGPKWLATNLLNLGLTVAAGLVVQHAWRHRNYVTVPLAVFSVLNLPAALWTQWNAWVSTHPSAYEQLYLTPYVRLLYMVVIVACLSVYLLRTVHAQARSEQTLQETVKRQHAELCHFYQEQQQRLSTEATRAEHERIMRDMHDNLGVHLVGLLAHLQKDDISRQTLHGEVRSIMDTLRMSIDSMESFDGDVLCMLGQVRYRIGQRLAEAGIELTWRISTVPEDIRVSPMALAHVQRMLIEVFVNILKHAKASTVAVQVDHNVAAQTCCICISDNGTGFDPALVNPGQGLKSMTWRASAVGATMSLQPNQPIGTTVSITLPCEPAARA